MSPDTAEIYQTYITDLFNTEAADAMVIGFGDFRETPDGQARDSTRFLYKKIIYGKIFKYAFCSDILLFPIHCWYGIHQTRIRICNLTLMLCTDIFNTCFANVFLTLLQT